METVRHFLMIVLLLGAAAACREKSSHGDAPAAPALPPAGLPPHATPGARPEVSNPTAGAEPVKVLSRPDEKLGPRLDEFNACIAGVADWVRSNDSAVVMPPAENLRVCRRRFEAMLAFSGLPVTEAYDEYFVLAARLVALLPDPDAGKTDGSFPVKAFIEAYNTFAMENNELLGVAATKPPEKPEASLPRRTYRERLILLATEVRDRVVKWHFDHRFETVGGDAQAAWINEPLPERARLFVLRTRMEASLDSFLSIKCEDAGTSPDVRISCRSLEDAAGELAHFVRGWVGAWDARLRDVQSRADCAACARAREDLEGRIRSIQGTDE